MTFEITFNDGSTETISCSSYIIDSGIIKFIDTDGNTLLMANMFSNVKYIRKV